MTDAYARRPARMSLVNLASGIVLEAQFNPSELTEKLSVNYTKLAVKGLSHKPLQYEGTENHAFEFELAYRAFDRDGNKLGDCMNARRFLLAACYSRRAAASVLTGAPPRLLFIWPTLVSLTAKVMSVEFKHTMFNQSGTPTQFSARLTLEEIRDTRLFSDDVQFDGTIRSGDAARSN